MIRMLVLVILIVLACLWIFEQGKEWQRNNGVPIVVKEKVAEPVTMTPAPQTQVSASPKKDWFAEKQRQAGTLMETGRGRRN